MFLLRKIQSHLHRQSLFPLSAPLESACHYFKVCVKMEGQTDFVNDYVKQSLLLFYLKQIHLNAVKSKHLIEFNRSLEFFLKKIILGLIFTHYSHVNMEEGWSVCYVYSGCDHD